MTAVGADPVLIDSGGSLYVDVVNNGLWPIIVGQDSEGRYGDVVRESGGYLRVQPEGDPVYAWAVRETEPSDITVTLTPVVTPLSGLESDAAPDVASLRTLGTGPHQAAPGDVVDGHTTAIANIEDDPRWTDARDLKAPTASVNVNAQRIINVADPTSPGDAANKSYVDAIAAGLSPKVAVRAATTGNITLSAPQTIDGVAVIAGDRVLVKDQTAPAENGVYIAATFAWSRATDADSSGELQRAFVYVSEGTTNPGTGWVVTTTGTITVGTTAITWAQFSSSGTVTASTGLTKVGVDVRAVFGSTSGTVAQGNDSRLSDTRTPTDNTVSTAKVQNLAVTTGKIAADAVDYSKIAPDALGHYNVKRFGAVGDGVTDDSAAILLAYQAAEAGRVAARSGVSNKRGRYVIFFPPGRYVINLNTTDNALMKAPTDVTANRTQGLVYKGCGKGISEILVTGATGTYLMRNNNIWYGVRFEGLAFDTTATAMTSAPSFGYHTSTGGGQNFQFRDCEIRGYWNEGNYQDGSDTNSEWKHYNTDFNGCAFTEGWVHSNMSTDQAVNFDFTDCNIILTNGGKFLRFDKGGAIRVRGGEVIIGDLGGNAAKAVTAIDLRGATHSGAGSSETFLWDGARCEIRDDTSKIISCGWGYGVVTFRNFADNVIARPTTQTTHLYTSPGTNPGPIAHYEDSLLTGRHEYEYGTGTYNQRRIAVYERSRLSQEPVNFITFTYDSSGSNNLGGRPQIHFRNVRVNTAIPGQGQTLFDCVLGWQYAIGGTPEVRRAAFRSAAGTLTNATYTLILPTNAVIRKVEMHKATAGSSTSTAWSYSVQTTEATPTVLATIAPGVGGVAAGTQWQSAFDYSYDLPLKFLADSDLKRTIQLVPNGSVPSTSLTGFNGWVLVEYLA